MYGKNTIMLFISLMTFNEILAQETPYYYGDGSSIFLQEPEKDSVLLLSSIDDVRLLTVDKAHDKLYFITNDQTRLERSNLDGGNREILWNNGRRPGTFGTRFIASIDYDFNEDIAFFSVSGNALAVLGGKTLLKLDLQSLSLDTLLTSNTPFAGVSLDTVNNSVYYVAHPSGIYKNDYAFANEELIADPMYLDDFAFHLQVDAANETLYWGEYEVLLNTPITKGFKKINLDGTGFKQIYTDNVDASYGFHYDFENGRIFCYNDTRGRLISCDLNGENIVNEEEVPSENENNYFTMTSTGFYLYEIGTIAWREFGSTEAESVLNGLYPFNESYEFDPISERFYFIKGGIIYSTNKDGGSMEPIFIPNLYTDFHTPIIAYGNRLFYIGEKSDTYYILEYDLTNDTVVDTLYSTNELILDFNLNPSDPSQGIVTAREVNWDTGDSYFIGFSGGFNISKVDADGNKTELLFFELDEPDLLTYNREDSKLYWVNRGDTNHGFFRVDADGSNVEKIKETIFESFRFVYDAVNVVPIIAPHVFEVDENAANQTVVGIVSASDPNGDAISYSIASGNDLGGFALNASTGGLTVANTSVLDYESHTSFTLSVEASDGISSSSNDVTINLNDLDESVTPVLSVASKEIQHLNIFPIPAQTYFKIELDQDIETIYLTDLTGKQIKSFRPSPKYNISDIPSGIYHLKIRTINNSWSRSIIIN